MAEEIDLYPQLGALPAFTEDGRINIPTQAAADVIAKQGEMYSADPTLQQRNNASVANFLTDTLGMDGRRAARFSDELIGGPRSALPFGMGLADITPMGIAYALDEAASGYAKAKEPLDYVMPTIMGALGAAETLFLGKLLAAPVKGFLKSLSGKLPSELPMDEVSRMARAKEQGFDLDAYHGTTSNFESVDKDKFGKSQAVFGDAFYSTTSPKRASTYAGDTGQVMPVMLQSEGMIDLTKPASVNTLTKISNVLTDAGAKVEVRDDGTFFAKLGDKSVFIDSYSPMDVNFKKLKDGFGKENAQKILEEAGIKGLIGSEALGTKVFANYDPTSIRSRFANFDPTKASSSNLLASSAPIAIGVGALSQLPEETGVE